MAERNTPKPESAEQLGQQILEFIDKTEFGSAEFQAVSDYLDLLAQREEGEDNARINEIEIALLKHQIRQNKSHLQGYSHTFGRIERDLSVLQTVSRSEAEQKFAEPAEQDGYVREIYSVAYNGAQEIVSMKKDAS